MALFRRKTRTWNDVKERFDKALTSGQALKIIKEGEALVKIDAPSTDDRNQVLLQMGKAALGEKLWNRALEFLDQISDASDSITIEVRLNLVELHLGQANSEEAQKAFSELQALADMPGFPAVKAMGFRVLTANLAENNQETFDVGETFLATAAPEDMGEAKYMEITLVFARAAKSMGIWTKAAKTYQRVMKEFPKTGWAATSKEELRKMRTSLETGRIEQLVAAREREQVQELLGEALGKTGWFERLKRGLSKTHRSFVGRLESVFRGRTQIDDDLIEEVEEILMSADLGVDTVVQIMEMIHRKTASKEMKKPEELLDFIKESLLGALNNMGTGVIDVERVAPFIILVIGVNGTGKTTTIAKLANKYKRQGKSVCLVAADTFRAGAIQQLTIWAERAGVEIIKHKEGANPAAVTYDALVAAQSRSYDIAIIDTAGRLHTKVNLMEELKKIHRTIAKVIPDAPHETLLVLDATTGQNAISQARLFSEAMPVDGIVITKLDGTAKGAIVISIANEFRIPVKFIGVGEQMDDLQDFNPQAFVDAIFADVER